MFQSHREAIRQIFKLPRPTVRETALFAMLYLVQAAVCLLFIEYVYRLAHLAGAIWAIISAVLALQPGVSQSVVTSVLRILANTVGALIAFVVGRYLGTSEWQMLVALTAVVAVCEVLRLDMALRTACVSVLIVMTANHGLVATTGLQRVSAVLIGCLTAVVLQGLTDFVRSIFFKRSEPTAAAMVAASAEPGKDAASRVHGE